MCSTASPPSATRQRDRSKSRPKWIRGNSGSGSSTAATLPATRWILSRYSEKLQRILGLDTIPQFVLQRPENETLYALAVVYACVGLGCCRARDVTSAPVRTLPSFSFKRAGQSISKLNLEILTWLRGESGPEPVL